jgi:hypothetical protein
MHDLSQHSRISSHWRDPLAPAAYTTGVSLHSHTSLSEETLSFIQAMGVRFPGIARLQRHYEGVCLKRHGLQLDFNRANWRPPLQPRMAYDVEARQIQKLGLYPLVSITDHDTIEAAQLLRTVPSSRHIPVSVEWSAPFGQTEFHLGIHNLPSSEGPAWMRRFAAFTAAPSDEKLLRMIRELHEDPQVLIVLNHPAWDLHKVGDCLHTCEVYRFLTLAGSCIHALELNGLRHSQENHVVTQIARDTKHVLISGGDRHGLEPNANLNLTSTTNFTEFVEEIRIDRHSHIHFMPQYKRRWEQRILSSTIIAVTDYPQFMPGWQKWDDRVFHPDRNGEMQQLSSLWPREQAPKAVRATIQAVRLLGMRGVSAPLSLAFPHVNDLSLEVERS